MSVEITFRTLKGSTFKVAASDSDTILDLKRKVASEQKIDDYAGYRLIYKGKILQDDATVLSSSITSSGFVVVMPPKKLPTKQSSKPSNTEACKTTTASAPPAPMSDKASVPKDAVSSAPEKMDVSTPSAASSDRKPVDDVSGSASGSTNASNTLVTGEAYNDSVKRICEMGFSEEQVKRAMHAAFNNPDRAVEFIFNGIPNEQEGAFASASGAAASDHSTRNTAGSVTNPGPIASAIEAEANSNRNTSTATESTPSARSDGSNTTPFNMFAPSGSGNAGNDGESGTGAGSLNFLRDFPVFGQIRRLVQANPAALPQILQQLDTVYPDVVALINANPREFTQLINEPLREGEGLQEDAMEQLAQAIASGGGDSSQLGSGDSTQVYVTEEESEQIARLNEFARSIGLAQAQVLETWLACNRDEDLTANFLFDHADELRADRADESRNNEQTNQPDADPEGGGSS